MIYYVGFIVTMLIYLETDICLENWEEQALKLLKAIKEKSHFTIQR